MARTLVKTIADNRKNLLINGGFDFWQRGITSSLTSVSSVFTADRFYTTLNQYTSGTLVAAQNTVEKEVDTNFCFELNASSIVTTGVMDVTQIMETLSVVPLRDKYMTVSVRMKVDVGASITMKIQDGTDTDAYPATSSTNTSEVKSVTTAWQTFTVTHQVQSGANSMILRITTPAAYTGILYIGKAMMNVGQEAAPFRLAGETIADELVACQRFYEKSYNLTVIPGTVSTAGLHSFGAPGTSIGNNQVIGDAIEYSVLKVKSATIVVYAENGTANAVSNNRAGNLSAGQVFSGNKAFSPLNTSGILAIGNLVTFHWTADSEL